MSHPPIATIASCPMQPETVSTLSAITSRETSEYFIPSVPIDIPSEIVIALYIIPFPPASSAALFTCSASLSICMLHGVTMLQVEQIPICGFLKSSSLNPTARSIDLLGACSTPSTTMLECLRKSLLFMVIPFK